MVYTIIGPIRGIFLDTGAEAEDSAVNFSKVSVSPLYKKISLLAKACTTQNSFLGRGSTFIHTPAGSNLPRIYFSVPICDWNLWKLHSPPIDMTYTTELYEML